MTEPRRGVIPPSPGSVPTGRAWPSSVPSVGGASSPSLRGSRVQRGPSGNLQSLMNRQSAGLQLDGVNEYMQYALSAGAGDGKSLVEQGSRLGAAFAQGSHDAFSAQSQLYGVRPDMASWLSVRIDPNRSGLRLSDNTQDSWARQRGVRRDTATYGQAANHFWQMEGDRLAATQEALIRGGFLKGDSIATFGRHDPAGRDHKAWLDALEMAARLNKEVFSMLDELGETGAWDDEMGGGGPVRRRPDVQLMSPDDANKMADTIGQELIGRKLSKEEKQKVVAAIHATQRREQSAAIDVSMSETGGGTMVSPTSPDVIAENTIRANNNTEVRGAEALGAFDKLLGMIGGGR